MYEVHSPQVPKYLRGKLALEKLSKAATYRGARRRRRHPITCQAHFTLIKKLPAAPARWRYWATVVRWLPRDAIPRNFISIIARIWIENQGEKSRHTHAKPKSLFISHAVSRLLSKFQILFQKNSFLSDLYTMTLRKAATFSTGHLLWRWIIIDWIFFFDTEWLIANFEMVPNISCYIWNGFGIY